MTTPNKHIEPKLSLSTDEALMQAISAILFKHDAMLINFEGMNTGEYNLEAKSILPLLNDCKNQMDVALLIDKVLSEWFSKNWAKVKSDTTKNIQLTEMSSAIWLALMQHQQDS